MEVLVQGATRGHRERWGNSGLALGDVRVSELSQQGPLPRDAREVPLLNEACCVSPTRLMAPSAMFRRPRGGDSKDRVRDEATRGVTVGAWGSGSCPHAEAAWGTPCRRTGLPSGSQGRPARRCVLRERWARGWDKARANERGQR